MSFPCVTAGSGGAKWGGDATDGRRRRPVRAARPAAASARPGVGSGAGAEPLFLPAHPSTGEQDGAISRDTKDSLIDCQRCSWADGAPRISDWLHASRVSCAAVGSCPVRRVISMTGAVPRPRLQDADRPLPGPAHSADAWLTPGCLATRSRAAMSVPGAALPPAPRRALTASTSRGSSASAGASFGELTIWHAGLGRREVGFLSVGRERGCTTCRAVMAPGYDPPGQRHLSTGNALP